jgi:hypothetical protein
MGRPSRRGYTLIYVLTLTLLAAVYGYIWTAPGAYQCCDNPGSRTCCGAR